MASQTQGIQQLLAAEKRAAEKVAEARKSKSYTAMHKYKNAFSSEFLIDFRAIQENINVKSI